MFNKIKYLLVFLVALMVCLPGYAQRESRNDNTQVQGSKQRVQLAIADITAKDLPPEARATLSLIEKGGPYPYDRDGIPFGNFEKRLPARERGHYREFTVKTPGVSHRGARRIIAGKTGERYYSDDHYNSFKRIVP